MCCATPKEIDLQLSFVNELRSQGVKVAVIGLDLPASVSLALPKNEIRIFATIEKALQSLMLNNRKEMLAFTGHRAVLAANASLLKVLAEQLKGSVNLITQEDVPGITNFIRLDAIIATLRSELRAHEAVGRSA